MDSGVATRPIADFDAYIEKLSEFVYKTNLFMKPIFSQARKEPKRVVLAEGGGDSGAARHPRSWCLWDWPNRFWWGARA